MSKHEEILSYIEGLEIGKQVSVRGIANRMKVADGTAYRAIKEAETLGADGILVMTPFYVKPTQEGIYQHFKTINDHRHTKPDHFSNRATISRSFGYFLVYHDIKIPAITSPLSS